MARSTTESPVASELARAVEPESGILHVVVRQFGRPSARNFFWHTLEKVVRVAIGIWLARFLGPGLFGQLSYAIALVGMVQLVAECGVDSVLRRDLLRRPEEGPQLVAAAVVLRLVAGVFSVVAILIVGWGQNLAAADMQLLGTLALQLFQPALAVGDPWLQCRLQARVSTTVQLVVVFVGAAIKVTVVMQGASLGVLACIISAETLAGALVLTVAAWRKGMRVRFTVALPAACVRLFRQSWVMLACGVAAAFTARVDLILVRRWCGDDQAGVYAAAVRFSEMTIIAAVALSVSLLPGLLRDREAGRDRYLATLQRYLDISSVFAFASALVVSVGAPVAVPLLLGPKYEAVTGVLVVHVWQAVFWYSGAARAQYLVNEQRYGVQFGTLLLGTGTICALNAVMIPGGGVMGAAAAVVINQAIVSWVTSFFLPDMRELAILQTKALFLPSAVRRLVQSWRREGMAGK